MNNLIIIPIILPLLVGMILVLFKNKIIFQRVVSLVTLVGMIVVSIYLMNTIKNDGIQTLQLGGWEAPFGIGIVADMFAILLVLTTAVVATCVLLFAFRSIGEDRERHYFYPLFLFLIAGVSGSFLTSDLFNLYVFFEVLLVASYVLISLGGEKRQLRESMTYVVINIISSALFLVGIAYLYTVTGTLSLAHLSSRVAEAGQDYLITTIAILLLLVFAIKAGLFLFYWLPGSYSAPPTAIAAIFAALLTKVGIYAIFRLFTLIFYHQPDVTHVFIGALAALTMILGGIGAIAYSDIHKILTYNVVIGVGFILAGLASFTYDGILGSIHYLMHDMVIKALIFLIGGAIIYITGSSHLKHMSGLIRTHPYLGWMFFIAALSLAGIPPLSGFIGKIFIVKGTFDQSLFWIGAVGLITSLLILYSMMKIFMNAFWGETILDVNEEKGSTKGMLFPIALLTLLTILLGVGAEGIMGYIEIATKALLDSSLYIDAVFNGNPIP